MPNPVDRTVATHTFFKGRLRMLTNEAQPVALQHVREDRMLGAIPPPSLADKALRERKTSRVSPLDGRGLLSGSRRRHARENQ
jgi:hypothetical protein